ncbi:Eco57I restriction-modification methylase domain-containing protein [Nannocystis punicea]|uniref:site-specific DNA-methyltransferase (adenine-specific) n=1 Tax=Nannocystis punicea TaxID=2995304 RepID=A0ABY7H8F7_9BACT|nr:hypothetical protein [Nannocystis poenicansa]WAS95380.1 hypothetical protein O0S08_04405 [Nannocystis poenicansa]
MSLELAGIHNVGEFYSQHYVDVVLAADLQPAIDAWPDEAHAPHRRLAALAGDFFKSYHRAGEHRGARRLQQAQEFHARLLAALGYTPAPAATALGRDLLLPTVATIDHRHRPYLWLVEAPFPPDRDRADPFGEHPRVEQYPEASRAGATVDRSWRDLFDGPLLRAEDAPRWLLFLAGTDVFLIDRDKYFAGKHLRFDLVELFRRGDRRALQLAAALLHADALRPDGATCRLDHLDDHSHRHAFAVSTDLKRGAREAIEQLANEVVHFHSGAAPSLVEQPGFADRLARECVVYLYRLLFLFYVEARGSELRIVPMHTDAYRRGYSLEALRDLELVPLDSPAARDGYYFDASLRALFRLIQRGYPTAPARPHDGAAGFVLSGLHGELFDDARTPLLASARLRNHVLQDVLRRLSLSRPQGKQRPGRISYAQLGINQLGAVYEGLLSFTGFFAREDVLEIRAAADLADDDARTWFVARSQLSAYSRDELVRDEHGQPVLHPRGKFLYRLAGREREKSASYYTPEVLTRCLTRHTLAERLHGTSADEILEWKICEPAMGSGAFLNEAIDQLADAYLARKQAELGRTIAAEHYAHERQRVKYRLAVHNCHGVDLNPLAAELGKVSLWLNVLHAGATAPSFALRIAVGNSLIGARRAVFAVDARGRIDEAEPTALSWASERREHDIYHFLLPDAGMVGFDDDKPLRSLAPEVVTRIKAWRRQMLAVDLASELPRLAAICARVDALWCAHLAERRSALRPPLSVWGQPEAPLESVDTYESSARALARADAPGRKLAAIMDAWCALWFWPIDHVDALPTRAQWLADVEHLLTSGDLDADTDRPALAVVRGVAREQRFFHWEVAFPEVFAAGGMDIVLGNPPWTKVVWEEASVLSDLQPRLGLDKSAAAVTPEVRRRLLADPAARRLYWRELTTNIGTRNFLNNRRLYPLLGGTASNLYKAFLVRAWSLAGPRAVVGLFHQTGVFDDPAGGPLRAELHHRLRFAARFQNKLMLFPEVLHTRPYAFTICGERRDAPDFRYVANLLHPRTLDECLAHDGSGEVPGIKGDDGEWDLRGHRDRLVRVDADALAVFRAVFDAPDTPLAEARLPIVHGAALLSILRKFAAAPRRMLDLADEYTVSEHFHETYQQQDGTIRRLTRRPDDLAQWIVSGPHYYVATPFARDPNEACRSHMDYTTIDLTAIASDYLPRTNYLPACSADVYAARSPRWRDAPLAARHRWIARKMLSPSGERTLIAAVLPPGPAHIGASVSLACSDDATMIHLAGLTASLPYDFWLKITGKSNLSNDVVKHLPLPDAGRAAIVLRALLLNCLTEHYARLWRDLFCEEFRRDRFAAVDPRLPTFTGLGPRWTPDTPLRTPFARRQALVELDVLAALALGLSLAELLSIYRLQFAVLQQNERATWYDRRGKVVFSDNVLLADLGVDRRRWPQIADARAGDALPPWARDAQGPYVPPFDRRDRESDLRRAYEHFTARL